ncbi:dihydroxyacetone kinase subunit DhaL [Actinacidiphila epipremni]|uniref:dihydroxyacetone kinase subunit DhaL n=1 Tax=Actinacidiphila epipremni TaxID=2053013 RepID=UPI0019D179C4|nr:dihydroxyacetone kinase subunit DhaL [Actinacidiphila epipremni]
MTGRQGEQLVPVPRLVGWFAGFTRDVALHADELSALDGAIGDADHGTNLNRGCREALRTLHAEPPRTVGDFGRTVGMQLLAHVGGASGVLYGSFFLDFGASAPGAQGLTPRGFAAAWHAGVAAVVARGRAEVGDKTMLDVLAPVRDALDTAAWHTVDLGGMLKAALDAAEQGLEATVPLVARKGRASYIGPRSAGHQDPGARSSWLLVRAATTTLAG